MDVALVSVTHALACQLDTTTDVEPGERIPFETEEVLVRVMLECLLLVASHTGVLLEEVIVADSSCQCREDTIRSTETEDGGEVIGYTCAVCELAHTRVV